MKTIILKTLTLINFKGIVNQVINFEGNTEIFAANEVGKSTLYTAFNWLLTGKDEFDRKDFEVKNTKRKELNSQSHEVEIVLCVNEHGIEFEYKLKRVYLEKWVKQKGQSQKTFEGHKTEFFYNDVPCNLNEYQTKVDAIIDNKIIKLVTNPTYFNNLPWQDQRKGLIGIAGEITDTDIFETIATAKNDYFNLINILNSGKTAEEYKKELAAKKLLLKKAAVEFVPRIDEAKRNMPDQKDWALLTDQLQKKEAELSHNSDLITNASKSLAEKQKGLMDKQRLVHTKQTEINNIRFKIKCELEAKQNDGAGAIAQAKQQIANLHTRIRQLEIENTNVATNIASYNASIEVKKATINKLRDEWKSINAETFEFDENSCTCPTCKQLLPQEDVQKQKQTLLSNFNASVSRRKDDKVAQSNQVKAEISQLEQSIESVNSVDYELKIAEELNSASQLTARLNTLELTERNKKIDDIEVAVSLLLSKNADYLNLQDEISSLQTEINQGQAIIDDTESNVLKDFARTLQADIDGIKQDLAIKDTILKTTARIAQLMSEEQANAQAIADLEQQEFEIETYTRAKMDILEKRVNSMFEYVNFRLFEVQVNGGIAETCLCEYKGVPYPTLNTAARLLAGIDVLNTFSKHYGINAPVFCDNRESVSWIPDSPSQIISLFVSANDKKLRVETGTQQRQEAA